MTDDSDPCKPKTSMHAQVAKEVSILFQKSQRKAALDSLPDATAFPKGVPYHRILMAIVRLSGGDPIKLAYFSERAVEDWRDVLYWSENPRAVSEPSSWEELRRRLRLPGEG